MNVYRIALCIVLVLNYCHQTESRKSSWLKRVDQTSREYTIFPNTMFKGSYISVRLICSTNATNAQIKVSWILQELECMEEMYDEQKNPVLGEVLTSVTYDMLQSSDHLITAPDRIVRSNADTVAYNETVEPVPEREMRPGAGVMMANFMISEPQVMDCTKDNLISLHDESTSPYYTGYFRQKLPAGDSDRFMWKRIPNDRSYLKEVSDNRVASAWENGIYHFALKIEPVTETLKFSAMVIVKMKSKGGYLPAIEWPLLPVRGVLAFLYLVMGSGWIFLWARSHQHSLKIHLVIGAVAVAGALANTVSFVELSTQHSTGNGLQGLRWIGMFLTVLQNGLMHLLVMIVSTGYGITRPTLHKTLLASAVCLAAALSLTQFMAIIVLDEDLRIKYKYGGLALGVNIVYFLFSLVIAGWMMIFSMMTFVHLCKRKHSSKKIIGFTVFTASCMFTFIVNLALGLVSLGITKGCSKDWRMEWLSESYGSMTVLMVMVVLMWLWRPVDEAQTYAFTPLNTEDLADHGDYDEDEEDDTLYEKVSLKIMDS